MNSDETNSNGKRPVGSNAARTDKNGAPLTEKKLRRLEKNRLSARECRRRKREATEHMQRQINLLEGENLRLRLQLQVGEEAEASTQQEQHKLTQVLDDLLKSGASEAEIYTKIEEYKEKFADYGRDRRSAIEFHLRNIERLLMPTQTTSVVLATLQMPVAEAPSEKPVGETRPTESNPQPASNSITEAAPPAAAPIPGSESQKPADDMPKKLDAKSLFRHLVEILRVTPEQAAALKDSRLVAQEMDECLKASLGVLKELRIRLTQCGEDLENEFNNVRSILTPTQAAKFLVWVANNKACIHMLNELWNRVYPQHHPGTPTDEDFLRNPEQPSP